MKHFKTIFYALALTTVLHACVESDDPIVPTQKLTGIDIENLDQTVKPTAGSTEPTAPSMKSTSKCAKH